jgi:ABC-type multidrug transport system fused ATPase/permease subunit
MRDNKIQYSFIDFFIVLASIFLSASVVFSADQMWLVGAVGVLFLYLYLKGKLKFHKRFILVILFLVVISLLQIIQNSFFSFWTEAGNIIRFTLPYFIVIAVGMNYVPLFVKSMRLITIVNFIFYIPSLLIPGFFSQISKIPALTGLDQFGQGTNFLIYTAEDGIRLGIRQNSAIFFEPGQFASYLVLAIILRIYLDKGFSLKNNLLFIFALLFTFSTAGYLFFFIVLFFYYLLTLSNKPAVVLLLVLVVYLGYNTYTGLDFMGEKIEKQYDRMIYESQYGYGSGSERTVTTYNDFLASLESPLIGLGRNQVTRYGKLDIGRIDRFIESNTPFDIAASYGYPFFFLYFYLIYLSFYRLCLYYEINKYYSLVFTSIIFIMYISQTLYLHNSFLILLYLNLFYPKNKYEKNFCSNSNLQS